MRCLWWEKKRAPDWGMLPYWAWPAMSVHHQSWWVRPVAQHISAPQGPRIMQVYQQAVGRQLRQRKLLGLTFKIPNIVLAQWSRQDFHSISTYPLFLPKPLYGKSYLGIYLIPFLPWWPLLQGWVFTVCMARCGQAAVGIHFSFHWISTPLYTVHFWE